MTQPCRRVVLALGSNLGNRLGYLQGGLDLICAARGLRCAAVSAVYETAPVGGPPQPDYLNAVLLAESALAPGEILDLCHAAERAGGRVRAQRWGPRTLDADIVACGTEVFRAPDLEVPHPRAHERAFVLMPWLDVDQAAILPGHGAVAELLADLSHSALRRRADLRLTLPSGSVARAAD